MRVNMNCQHIFGSGVAEHYSRILTPDGRELSLTDAAAEGLIARGQTYEANNGFKAFLDQDIEPLVPGLQVRQHHWAKPGPTDNPTVTPL